jgi:hypothetical protein
MRHHIVRITLFLLAIAFIIAVAWFVSSPDYEPALTSLAFLTTITGLFIDRWLAAREKRRELLYALAHELYMNLQILNDPKFKSQDELCKSPIVYPRLFSSVLSTAISSGAFTETRDRHLFRLMHQWQERVSEFNRRLDITELRTFLHPNEKELKAFRERLTDGAVLSDTQDVLRELSSHLVDKYAKESGVGRDTVLFDVSEK